MFIQRSFSFFKAEGEKDDTLKWDVIICAWFILTSINSSVQMKGIVIFVVLTFCDWSQTYVIIKSLLEKYSFIYSVHFVNFIIYVN